MLTWPFLGGHFSCPLFVLGTLADRLGGDSRAVFGPLRVRVWAELIPGRFHIHSSGGAF